MFAKKKKELTFNIDIEETDDRMPEYRYLARVSVKHGFSFLRTFWGSSREDVETQARAFIERVKNGETHYRITI